MCCSRAVPFDLGGIGGASLIATWALYHELVTVRDPCVSAPMFFIWNRDTSQLKDQTIRVDTWTPTVIPNGHSFEILEK